MRYFKYLLESTMVKIFIPLAINLCQKFHISPTKILLPLSYAAIFGGTLTLIGTSTNIIVNTFLEEKGLQIRCPERTVATVDHIVPTIDQRRPFQDPLAEEMLSTLEKNCKKYE